jgi:DNA-binding beta-propeller fold protein YncE
MTRLALIAPLFLLTLFAPAAHADGCPPSTCGTSASAEPGSRYLTVRTNGQAGPLVLYDVVSRRQHVSLPRGLASADGRTYVSARTLGKQATLLTRYSLPSGRVVATRRLPGRQWLAAISPNGRRVLVQYRAPKGFTRYAVLDGMRTTRAVSLRGNYEVETLSPDGQRIFLIHWTPTGRYDLRRFDLRTSKITATPTRSSESGEVEKMQGTAWVGVPSRNGNWLLTLYVKYDGSAFIHALDLRAGIGHCIDLEGVHGDLNTVGTSVLALSPNQRMLYVAMPLVGRIFALDLRKLELTRTVRFAPISAASYGFGINPSAALTPNGRMLYFAAGQKLWGLDTASWRLRSSSSLGAQAAATGVTPDGRRVVVLRIDRKVVVRDAATLR